VFFKLIKVHLLVSDLYINDSEFVNIGALTAMLCLLASYFLDEI